MPPHALYIIGLGAICVAIIVVILADEFSGRKKK